MNSTYVSIWLTGLPCSGKTTLAGLLHDHLTVKGIKVIHLDGDKVRKGLSKDLGFTAGDRRENIQRSAEVNWLFMGSITLNFLQILYKNA